MRIAVVFLGFLLAATRLSAAVLLTDEIIRPTRHSGSWTPSSVYQLMAFTADGPEVTIIFSAQTHSTETNNWLRQAVDNVAVVTRSVYDAHLVARNQGDLGNYFWLQIEPSYPIFFFDHTSVDPGDFLLFDRFDAGPNAGWDLSNQAFWIPPTSFDYNAPSAPTDNLDDPSTATGGSLGLGAVDDAGTASAQIVVPGLQAGTQYVLAFWWTGANDNVDENGDPNPNGDLFVQVIGDEPVHVEETTWTGVKALFRRPQ